MVSINGLRCVVCRSDELGHGPGALHCQACGADFPVLGGVPVLFDAVEVEDGAAVERSAARQVLAAFGLPCDPLSVLRVGTLMRRRVRFGGSLIQVESQQFLHRVRNSGQDVDVRTASDDRAPAPRDLLAVPRYRWTRHYVPRRMAPGAPFLANLRFENTGGVPLFKDGPGRATIAQRWARRDGSPVASADQRTELPIDVQPGQALTVAAGIAPPAEPGAYRLTVLFVQEQVRWLEADALKVAVTVEPETAAPAPEGWAVLPDAPPSYDADHEKGRDMLAGWLRRHAPARPRVLEVGGNAAPMLSRLGAEFGPDLVNVDVDLLGLQVGHLLTRQSDAPVRHLCADAFDLPFASCYFDAIVIFASLHHFPDPAALLEHLRRKLRPGGFIGLFCEPVGHVWPGAVLPAFLAELERGVNEQSFSLREYELMFKRAELQAAEVLVDGNSLKARLVHAVSA